MDPLVIVSPHLDDAVLSCGQLMAGRPDCVVVTVFAGTPANGRRLTTFDRNSGFTSAAHAMRDRWAEDDDALNRLHATAVRLDFTDNQYGETDADERALAQTLVGAIRSIGARETFGPLGLAHPDHHRTRRAYCQALRALPMVQPWLYEDMPARVLWPETVPDALAWWNGMGWQGELAFAGTGPRAAKVAAVERYRSQLWALDPPTYLVPERHYRLTWCPAP